MGGVWLMQRKRASSRNALVVEDLILKSRRRIAILLRLVGLDEDTIGPECARCVGDEKALGDRCLAIGASAKAAASSMWEKRYSHGRPGPQTRAGFPYGELPTLTTRSAASPSSQKGTDGRRPTAVDAAALRGLQLAAIYGNDLQPVCVDLFH
jgi:hypothetical protein